MMGRMKTIPELTTYEHIKELSIESNRELGKEILAYDHITIDENKPEHVKTRVHVPTGQTRMVDFKSEGNTLAWSCTCGSASGKNDVFCKHCVATALKLAEPDVEEKGGE